VCGHVTPLAAGNVLLEWTTGSGSCQAGCLASADVQKSAHPGCVVAACSQVLPLSLQMYGCRVMQKALEVLDVDTQCSLITELDGNIMRCVRDQVRILYYFF